MSIFSFSPDVSMMSRRFLTVALALALCHHVDHALRVDHSGWPFRDAVTPFTYSLGAYPVILFAAFGPARAFWIRWALLVGATAFTLYAHTAIESPAAQFHMWAHNRSLHQYGGPNALNAQSQLMGALSVVVGMALNLVAVVACVSMLSTRLRKKVSR